MPQDSGAESNGPTDIAAAARRLLDEAQAEEVPEKLVELARKLEDTLAEKRKAADPGT